VVHERYELGPGRVGFEAAKHALMAAQDIAARRVPG
jgi:hypothetical protein